MLNSPVVFNRIVTSHLRCSFIWLL